MTASVQEYNPTSDTWSSKTNYPIAVRDLTAELANDNQVHVFGGIDDSPDLNIYSTHFTELINLSNKNLNIPLVKQTSEPWASKEYDSASIWNPTDSRIYSWGCALTSAVMVFKYYGLNNLPGNIQLDPGSLNTWLKKQKDGYIGNGSVNWLALSRLSKQLAGVNNIVSFHALEFKKIVTSDESKVIDDLKNDIPDILNVPGHFIVAKGIINDTIIINDPGFNRNSLDNYNSTFTGINKFYPSNTDLSYIMLTVQPNIDIKLKDSNNNSIGLAFLENTINNLNQNGQNNGEPLKIIFLQKPEAQNYRVELGSNYKTTYKLGIYLYDINGEVLKSEERGNLNANQKKSINFYFNGHEEIYNKKITFGKFGSDLNKSFKDNYISSALYIELNNLLSEADNLKKNKNDEECLRILSLIENLLNENISNIHPIAFSLFLYDVNYLQTHL